MSWRKPLYRDLIWACIHHKRLQMVEEVSSVSHDGLLNDLLCHLNKDYYEKFYASVDEAIDMCRSENLVDHLLKMSVIPLCIMEEHIPKDFPRSFCLAEFTLGELGLTEGYPKDPI